MVTKDVIAALSSQLREGVDVHRCAAAKALGQIGRSESAPVLCEALLDEDPDVRADAAVALCRIAHPETADKLMENLIGDPCGEVKISAIDSLVAMRHAPVIPWLRRLAAGRDEEIAWDDDEFYTGGWDDWLDVQLAAIRGLGELGAADGVAEICAAFHDEMGQDVSEHAIAALVRLGETGAAALTELFNGGDDRLRRRIAGVVGASPQSELLDLQDRCLGDDSVEVRRAVAAGLAVADAADERLVALFSDPDADLRESMVRLCGASFSVETRRRLEDPSPAVKCAAFRVVAQHPGLFERQGFDEIIRANVAGHPLVSGEAAIAWTAITGSDALAALKTSFCDTAQPVEFRRLLVKALARLGPEAVDVLASAAGDDDRQIRLGVLTALAEVAATETEWPGPAGQVLLAALDGDLVLPPEPAAEDGGEAGPSGDADEETAGAETAADEAAQDESPEAAPAPEAEEESAPAKTSTLDVILSGNDDAGGKPEEPAPREVKLTDEDVKRMELAERRKIAKKKVSLDVEIAPHQDVRRFAAQLLGDIAEPDVAERLISLLDADDAELRQSALESLARVAEALGKLPEAAVEPLQAALAGKKQEMSRPAVRALAWVPGEEISNRLREWLADEEIHIRLEAVRGLAARGEIDDEFRAMLKDSFPGIRIAVAGALAKAQGAEALDTLVDFAFADDGMYRREVGRLLRDIAPQEAMQRFLAVLADESRRREWLVAIDALGELAGYCDEAPAQAAA